MKKRVKQTLATPKSWYILLLNLLFVLFLLINIITPQMGEDYALRPWSFTYASIGNWNLSYIRDAFVRMIHQSRDWNVRLGEQISILFGAFPTIVFNISNALMSVFFIHIVYLYAFPCEEINYRKAVFGAAMTFMLIISFQPVIGEVFFWRAGSANYLWAVSILLAFALPIYYLFNDINLFENKKIFAVLHTVMGFFAGFTNENTVLIVIVLYILVACYVLFIKKETVKAWVISSFVFLCTGFAYMMLAPSTLRRWNYLEGPGSDERSIIITMMSRVPDVVFNTILYTFAYIIICLIAILVFIAINSFYTTKKDATIINMLLPQSFTKNIILLLTSTVSVAAMTAIDYFRIRAFFGLTFFLLVTIIYCFISVMLKSRKWARVSYVVMGILAAITLYQYSQLHRTFYDYNRFTERRAGYLVTAATVGVGNVEFEIFQFPHSQRILAPDRELWFYPFESGANWSFANFYGLNSVMFIGEPSTWVKIYWRQPDNASNILFSLELVNIDKYSHILHLAGWAIAEGVYSKDNDVEIHFVGTNETIIKPATSEARPDVAEFFDNYRYTYAGFRGSVSTNDFRQKDYYIYVIKRGDGIEHRIDTGFRLFVRV